MRKLRLIAAIAASCVSIWAEPAAHPQQAPDPVVIGTIPNLQPPDGLKPVSSGGHSYFPGRQRPLPYAAALSAEGSSIEHHQRLATTSTAQLLAEHYAKQLTSHGWTMAFKQFEPKFATARLSATSSVGPLVGLLSVVSFPSGQTMVSIMLINPAAPWRDSGRRGGGGAGVSQGITMSFGEGSPIQLIPATLQMPPSVTKAENRSGGGSPDFKYRDTRLQATSAPGDLMAQFLKQLPADGWSVGGKVSTPVHSITVRSSAATGTSQLWILTAIPGKLDVDFRLAVLAHRR